MHMSISLKMFLHVIPPSHQDLRILNQTSLIPLRNHQSLRLQQTSSSDLLPGRKELDYYFFLGTIYCWLASMYLYATHFHKNRHFLLIGLLQNDCDLPT